MGLTFKAIQYKAPNGIGAATRSNEIVLRLATRTGKIREVILTTEEAYKLMYSTWAAIADQHNEKRLKSGAPSK